MKTSRFVLFLIGTALIVLPTRVAVADDATTTTPTMPSGDKVGRLKAALAQLDLTDDQKAKIKDIFTNVTDRKERRQQIVAVLTPEQKEKLKQMIQERRDAQESGATMPAAN